MRLDERAAAPDARDVAAQGVGAQKTDAGAAQDETKKIQAGDERVGVLVRFRELVRFRVLDVGAIVDSRRRLAQGSYRASSRVQDAINHFPARERRRNVSFRFTRAVRNLERSVRLAPQAQRHATRAS